MISHRIMRIDDLYNNTKIPWTYEQCLMREIFYLNRRAWQCNIHGEYDFTELILNKFKNESTY